MRKIKATCGIGFYDDHEEEFEFPDDYTDDEITQEIWDWAMQFLNANWEEVNDEDGEDDY